MRLTRLLPLAAAALLAACADSPTAPLAPGAASYEEGNFGTGGDQSTATEGGNYFGSGNASTGSSDSGSSSEPARGNYFGSGN